jgi:hypothetical protein
MPHRTLPPTSAIWSVRSGVGSRYVRTPSAPCGHICAVVRVGYCTQGQRKTTHVRGAEVERLEDDGEPAEANEPELAEREPAVREPDRGVQRELVRERRDARLHDAQPHPDPAARHDEGRLEYERARSDAKREEHVLLRAARLLARHGRALALGRAERLAALAPLVHPRRPHVHKHERGAERRDAEERAARADERLARGDARERQRGLDAPARREQRRLGDRRGGAEGRVEERAGEERG